VKVILQLISSETGIPLRILTGSEEGALASTQDKDSWLDVISERRDEFAEVEIVRPFLDVLMEYGVLPALSDTYKVHWSDLYSPSAKEQADVSYKKTQTLQMYASTPGADIIMPPKMFFEKFMGWGYTDIKKYEKAIGSFDELERQFDELADKMAPTAAPKGGNDD